MPDDLLLDTCAFLWLVSGQPGLSRRTLDRIDRARSVRISAISAWEISLKHARGAIILPGDPLDWFTAAVEAHGLTVAPLEIDILIGANRLPWHHRDPADRFIIATALRHSLTVVTSDQQFAQYGIAVIS